MFERVGTLCSTSLRFLTSISAIPPPRAYLAGLRADLLHQKLANLLQIYCCLCSAHTLCAASTKYTMGVAAIALWSIKLEAKVGFESGALFHRLTIHLSA